MPVITENRTSPPGYVRPFRLDQSPSFLSVLGEALARAGGYTAEALDVERRRKAEEERMKRQEEEQALRLQLLLRNIGVEEAMAPVPGERPTGEIQTQRRDVTGLAGGFGGAGAPAGGGGLAVGAPVTIPMTEPTPPQEVNIPAISFRGQEVAPARVIPRTFQAEIEKAKREAGTEVLSPEAWGELPEFFKVRWKPWQRVSAESMGTLGMEIVKEAARKAEKAGAAPTSRVIGNRVKEWEPETKTWKDIGPSEGPKAPIWVTDTSTGKRVMVNPGTVAANPGRYSDVGVPKLTWVTETSTGKRIQVTDADLASAKPGTYSDVKPGRAALSSSQMAQSRETALKILGSPSDTKGDSIWALSKKVTMPGPSAAVGPLRQLLRPAMHFARAAGASPDIELYESQIEGFIPLFARAVGHSGVLTEKDVKHTRALFPELGDPAEIAKRKLARLQEMMNKGQAPPGLFEPQAEAGAETGAELTPEEEQILRDHGFVK